jgi:hypothetical protein
VFLPLFLRPLFFHFLPFFHRIFSHARNTLFMTAPLFTHPSRITIMRLFRKKSPEQLYNFFARVCEIYLVLFRKFVRNFFSPFSQHLATFSHLFGIAFVRFFRTNARNFARTLIIKRKEKFDGRVAFARFFRKNVRNSAIL